MKKELMKSLEGKGGFTLKDFVEHVNRLIPHFVGKQRRYKTSDFINERTVRFYMNEGLLDKPTQHRGRNSIFTSTHVLKILCIKRLQAAYIPLKKIAEVMRLLDIEELKMILLGRKGVDLVGSLASSDFIGSRRKENLDLAPRQLTLNAAAESNKDLFSQNWKRYKIHEKVELNIEGKFEIDYRGLDFQNIVSNAAQCLACHDSHLPEKGNTGMEGVDYEDQDFGYYAPALPMKSQSRKVVALITEGGLVPKGNPNRLESARASGFLKYCIKGVHDLKSGLFESIDRGWDNKHVNHDPNRLLPLDIMREIERTDTFIELHQYFYTTTGVGMYVDQAKKMGKRMARQLKAEGVSAVIFTST